MPNEKFITYDNLETYTEEIEDVIDEKINAVQPKYSSDQTAWDTAPTQDSVKPVTSGGIYTALQNAGGTQLYKHVIRVSGTQRDLKIGETTSSSSTSVDLVVISTRSTTYGSFSNIYSDGNYVNLFCKSAGGDMYLFTVCVINSTNFRAVRTDLVNAKIHEFESSSLGTIDDTVTAL